jgi:hypothetical protein
LELPKRCIKLFGYVWDVVLDPFAGSGTTLIAPLMRAAVNGGGHTMTSQQSTPQQTVEVLKQNGFRIIQEREVVYAIPPTYFAPLSRASDLLSRVELFRKYASDAIPEEVLSRIRSVAQDYNFSLEGVSKVILSAAVIAVVEDNQSVYQLDVLPATSENIGVLLFIFCNSGVRRTAGTLSGALLSVGTA